MKFDILCTVYGLQSEPVTRYTFTGVKTTGNAATALKATARKYYDTLCAVHPVTVTNWAVIDPATGEKIATTQIHLNPFNSRAIYTGFKALELPTAEIVTA